MKSSYQRRWENKDNQKGRKETMSQGMGEKDDDEEKWGVPNREIQKKQKERENDELVVDREEGKKKK